MLYLKFALVVWCFQLFGEDSWFLLPYSTPHLSFPSMSLKFKCQNDCLPCPIEISAELSLNPCTPKCVFPFEPTNHHFIKSKSLVHIPSLKSEGISVISSPIDQHLLRLTRREPSPDLVGLATRLIVVWCWPWILPFQPEVNLGTNIVATILGKKLFVC